MKVRKRDGRLANFNELKIIEAIKLASDNTKSNNKITDEQIKNIISFIKSSLDGKEEIEVDEVHNLVEKYLKKENKDVAKTYIDYRKERDLNRYKNMPLTKQRLSKVDGKNNERQNANINAICFSGRKSESHSVEDKEDALNFYMSPKFAKLHRDNILYIHDLDSFTIGEHNCLSYPIDDSLSTSTRIKDSDLRKAGRVSSALSNSAVFLQVQSQEQFGGVSLTHLDTTMIPYVRKSFYKNYVKYMKILKHREFKFENYENTSIDSNIYKNWWNKKVYKCALEDTIEECNQGMEAFFHNLNSLLSRSGGQLPFTSINFGKDTTVEGRMINKAIHKASMDGIGEYGRTSIFPCQIFQLDDKVNAYEGTPNYDLFKDAVESTANRLYPNYANSQWSVQLKGLKKDRELKRKVIHDIFENDKHLYEMLYQFVKDYPNEALKMNLEIKNNGISVTDNVYPTEDFSTMGCLGGKEHLYVKVNNEILDVSIKEFFEMCKTNKFNGRKAQLFFNKSENDYGLKIKVDRNRPFEHKSGVYKITHIPTDTTYIGSTSDIKRRFNEHRNNIAKHGGLDGGINYEDNFLENYKFEVIEYCDNYKEVENKYIELIPNINYKGTSQQYYKVSNAVKSQDVNTVKPNLEVVYEPQELINLEDKDIKVLDIDGRWTKIKHIFRNTPNSSPLMMHIYYKEHNHIYEIDATCDHPFFNGNGFTKAEDLKVGDYLYRADNLPLEIINITWTTMKVESFDIGTESGTFVGSDIKMHNCRTNNGFDINFDENYFKSLIIETLKQKKIPINYLTSAMQRDGRGNICPATLILPTIAMLAKKKSEKNESNIIDEFMKLLGKYIEDCKDELIERFNFIASQSADSAPFMYINNTMKGYVKEEGIVSALKHGTLAIGQIGLAETLQILVGCDQCEKKGMNLAKKIERLFSDKCEEYKIKYKLNFGVYYTPAENLMRTSYLKFKNKYGLIENVTAYKNEKGELVERGYFTNSIHVPVWKKISPFEKIDIESQLTGYSSAGCITYVELDEYAPNNLKAIEDIIIYAKKKDIPYFAINIPLDFCTKCGYRGVIKGDCCPNCGAKEYEEILDEKGNVVKRILTKFIERLRRVTGYLTGNYRVTFNDGKQMETDDREKHSNYMNGWSHN